MALGNDCSYLLGFLNNDGTRSQNISLVSFRMSEGVFSAGDFLFMRFPAYLCPHIKAVANSGMLSIDNRTCVLHEHMHMWFLNFYLYMQKTFHKTIEISL